MKLDGNSESIREAIDAGLLAGALTVVWQGGKVLQVSELGHRDVHAGLPMPVSYTHLTLPTTPYV